MMNRREFFKSQSRTLLLAAVAPAALAACATNPTTGAVTLDASVVTFIQNAVATAAKYIPTINSIATAAASLFGPGYVATVQFGSAAVNTVINALVGVVGTLSLAAASRLSSKLSVADPGTPVLIGRLRNGAPILGYRT
jgi:hypothetical protein